MNLNKITLSTFTLKRKLPAIKMLYGNNMERRLEVRSHKLLIHKILILQKKLILSRAYLNHRCFFLSRHGKNAISGIVYDLQSHGYSF